MKQLNYTIVRRRRSYSYNFMKQPNHTIVWTWRSFFCNITRKINHNCCFKGNYCNITRQRNQNCCSKGNYYLPWERNCPAEFVFSSRLCNWTMFKNYQVSKIHFRFFEYFEIEIHRHIWKQGGLPKSKHIPVTILSYIILSTL